jgi:hypothetical protein
MAETEGSELAIQTSMILESDKQISSVGAPTCAPAFSEYRTARPDSSSKQTTQNPLKY